MGEEEKRLLTMKHNMGVDLARVVAMYFVVVWHYVQFGGVAWNVSPEKTFCAKLFSSFAICAVDLYALISGYVGVTHTPKWRRFGKLWLQVWVTGLVGLSVAVVFFGAKVGLHEWVRALFPLVRCEYWYFTAYAGVFFLMPILNAGLRTVSKRDATILLCALLALTTCAGMVFKMDFLHLNGGYSIWWLMICYLLGGCLRLHVDLKRLSNRALVVIAFLGYAVTALNAILPYPDGRKPFFSYTSPSVLILAATLLIVFAKLRINSGGGGGCRIYRADGLWRLPVACSAGHLESDLVGRVQAIGGVALAVVCVILYGRTVGDFWRVVNS